MPIPQSRWYCLTPDRFVVGLLVMECLLWLSERFQWFGFNAHKGWTMLIAVTAVGVAFVLMLLWFAVALLFRWRFQFSIRSLLVLVVVVAVPCSWLAVEIKNAKRQRNAIEAINEFGGFVSYNIYCGPLDSIYVQPNSGWLNTLLGDEFVSVTFYNKITVTDAALENFAALKHVQMLILSGTKVTDVGLEHLKGMKQLEFLELSGTEVTDAGLENLKGLDQLQRLELVATRITDAGLEHLKGLNQLRRLRLDGTKVTDVGLEHLKGMNQLEFLV